MFFYNVGKDTFFWIIVGDNVHTSDSFLDVTGRTFSLKNAVVEDFLAEVKLRDAVTKGGRLAKEAMLEFLEENRSLTLTEPFIVRRLLGQRSCAYAEGQ